MIPSFSIRAVVAFVTLLIARTVIGERRPLVKREENRPREVPERRRAHRIITNHVIPPRNDFRRDLIRKPRRSTFCFPRAKSRFSLINALENVFSFISGTRGLDALMYTLREIFAQNAAPREAFPEIISRCKSSEQ